MIVGHISEIATLSLFTLAFFPSVVNAESECFQNAMDCHQLPRDDDCLEEHLPTDGHRGVLISSSGETKSKILICADT